MKYENFSLLSDEEVIKYSKTPEGREFLKLWLREAQDQFVKYKSLLLNLHHQILTLDNDILRRSVFDETRQYLEKKRQDLQNNLDRIKGFSDELYKKISIVQRLTTNFKPIPTVNLFQNIKPFKIKLFEVLAITFIVPLFLLMFNYFKNLSKANYIITGQAVYPIANYFFVSIFLGIFILLFLVFVFKKK
ncbi:MAG: hypothetical protein QXQ18_02130 [Candidatus Aenigmatarchaeota archaeon]